MLLWLLVVLLFLLVVVDGCCGCLERTLGGDTQFQSWRSRWCPSTPATSFRDVCKWIETCLRQWETGLWWSFHRGSDLSYEERGAWVRYRFLSGIHRRQASSARPINLCWWVVLSCHVLFYLKQRIKLRTAKQTTPHHTTQHHTTPHHTTPHNTTHHTTQDIPIFISQLYQASSNLYSSAGWSYLIFKSFLNNSITTRPWCLLFS